MQRLRGTRSPTPARAQQPHARIGRGHGGDECHGILGRSIVADDRLKLAQRLAEHGSPRGCYELSGVIGGDQDGDTQRLFGRYFVETANARTGVVLGHASFRPIHDVASIE